MSEADNANELLLVGVCTYLRPRMLSVLLDACARLESLPGLRVELLIVDNDPAGSARATVEAKRHSLPMPVHYFVESARGIASARNRVLIEALALGADYLAFIDDDEVPRPDWLVALHRVMRETGADAVGAHVFSDLPENAPAWAHTLPSSPKYESLYGHRKKKPRVHPSTNNVLMRARLFRDLGLRFDPRFGLSSAEDPDFFMRAKRAGATYAFAPDAAVMEHIPPSRLTLRWRFNRCINFACHGVQIHRLHHGGKSAWRHYFLRSLPGFVTGPTFLFCAPLVGPEVLSRGIKHLGGSIGMIEGLLGKMPAEYREIHGS